MNLRMSHNTASMATAPPDGLYEGVLDVRSGSGPMHMWSKRFVRMCTDALIVFSSANQPVVHHVAPLLHIGDVCQLEKNPERFVVSFIHRSTGKLKTLTMSCESTDQAQVWVQAIATRKDGLWKEQANGSLILEQSANSSCRKRFSLPFVVSEFDDVSDRTAQRGRSRTIARHHTYRDAESSHASVEDDRPRLARPGIHRRQQSDVRRQPLHDEDTSQFRKALSSILSDIGGIQAVRLADVIGNDGSLLRQLLNLAGRRRPAVDTYKSGSGTGNIQSEIESLLTSLLRDARFEAALDLVPLCNDPETSAVAVHLKWSLVKGKRGARDKFASFLESHLSGDRFTEEVGAAVVLCLKGEPTQRFPKLLRFPAAWKGLLIATVHAPSPVKNSIFRELTWMILEEPTNSQTLLSQAEWPEWLLQPVVFENASTQQRDTHIQLRMHFVVILHFSMMMTSTEFETVFTRMLEHMCRWGSSGRDSASTIIGFLLSKLIRQKQLFRNDYTATYYSNLIRLLEIIANFVFCTWDWAECPGEFRPPVSYWDLPSSLALPDNAATRFVPTQHGYDPSYDVSEAVCKFLAAIGFNGDSEQAGFRVTALPEERPVVASLQHWAEFYRDAMLLLAVVAPRRASLSASVHIGPQIRAFLQCSSPAKRLDICAKLVSAPIGTRENERHRNETTIARVLEYHLRNRFQDRPPIPAVLTTIRRSLGCEDRRNARFSGSELVDALLGTGLAAAPDSAAYIAILLLAAQRFEPVNTRSAVFANDASLYYRFVDSDAGPARHRYHHLDKGGPLSPASLRRVSAPLP